MNSLSPTAVQVRFWTRQFRYRDGCFYYWFWECFKESSFCIPSSVDGYQRWFLYHHSLFTRTFKAPSKVSNSSHWKRCFNFTLMKFMAGQADDPATNLLTGFCTSWGVPISTRQLTPVPAGFLVADMITIWSASVIASVGRELRRCSSDTTVDFRNFSTHGYTKFSIKFDKVRPSKNTFASRTRPLGHTLTLTAERSAGLRSRILSNPRISAVVHVVDIFLAIYIQTKCHVIVHSHVGKNVVWNQRLSRSLVPRCFTTVPSIIHLLWCLQDNDHTKDLIYHPEGPTKTINSLSLMSKLKLQLSSVRCLDIFCKYFLRFNSTTMVLLWFYSSIVNETFYKSMASLTKKKKSFCASYWNSGWFRLNHVL